MASSLPQRLPGLLVVSLFFALVTDALVLPASLSCRQPTRFTATSVTGTRPQASTLSLSSSSSFSFSFPTALYPSSLNCKSSSHSLTSLRAIEIVDGTTGQDEEDDTPAPTGTFAWFKKWWQKTAKIDRKKLAALGASALCSYGLVSNINYCGTLCASFIIFTKRYNVSPLARGQWKTFLGVYGTLWVGMNFLRPLRVWLALGITPIFDKCVERIRERLNVKKSVALGITIFLVNICGTFSFLGTGLYLSSLYTGVPLFPPKL